jgi:L-lysine 6-transaminase
MITAHDPYKTRPADVHDTLKKYMLADGFSVVYDFEKSRGIDLYDSRHGETYLDLFSFFASQPVGYNHPRIIEPEFVAKLGQIAIAKPTNSDLYTQAMADFVRTFGDVAIPESHRSHLFFIEGGALAVENALKAAFDWKFQKNREKGLPDDENLEIVHFQHAFHGRSGYTLSLTNTHDPRKYKWFPKFPWPRVSTPGAVYPATPQNLERTKSLEAQSLAEIEAALRGRQHKIAGIIIETIQGEGGDIHFRPEFLRALREICDRDEIVLIFDEVQCGMGITGNWWAWEETGVAPDIFTFGKKAQVCGIASTKRIDEVEGVFRIPSRINSTWGGNLVDMVRSQRFIEIIRDENLLANAKAVGAYIVQGLEKIARDTQKISGVRGRGLMIAFDLPTDTERDAMRRRMFDNKAIILGCGERSLRFRPVLDMDMTAADRALDVIRRSV